MTDQARTGAGTAEILAVAGVSVSLAGRQILDDVSFTVGAGQFTGLIGPNGAGKTTLLRVILGLQRPTAGSVAVLGRPRSRRNPSIGYVPQKVLLDPDMPMRARDLVALGPRRAPLRDTAALAGAPGRGRARCCTRSTPSASPTPGSGICPAASSSGC